MVCTKKWTIILILLWKIIQAYLSSGIYCRAVLKLKSGLLIKNSSSVCLSSPTVFVFSEYSWCKYKTFMFTLSSHYIKPEGDRSSSNPSGGQQKSYIWSIVHPHAHGEVSHLPPCGRLQRMALFRCLCLISHCAMRQNPYRKQLWVCSYHPMQWKYIFVSPWSFKVYNRKENFRLIMQKKKKKKYQRAFYFFLNVKI